MSESDPKAFPQTHVAVRLDDATRARLDALLPRLSTPSRSATRSDVLRAVILLGLRIAEVSPERLSGSGDE
jgi:hypothetical protein